MKKIASSSEQHGNLPSHLSSVYISVKSRMFSQLSYYKMVEMVEPFLVDQSKNVDELEASILATDWLVAANNAIKHAKK